MMKTKHFIWICVGLLIFMTLIFIGNIITIGDKLTSVSIYLSWVFYLLIIVFVAFFIVIPILKVIFTPEIEGEPLEQIEQLTPSNLSNYIKRLKLSSDQRRKLSLSSDRVSTLKAIIESKRSEMNDIVKKRATTVFVVTAISQNGTIDIISNIGLNFQMINSLIKQSGYRPSYLQLIKMYLSVFSTSILIASIDDILDDIDFGELCGSIGLVISNIATRSITNGAMNAFIALKIGYATIKYLQMGGKQFKKNKPELRKNVRKEAIKSLIDVSKDGMREVKSKLVAVFG